MVCFKLAALAVHGCCLVVINIFKPYLIRKPSIHQSIAYFYYLKCLYITLAKKQTRSTAMFGLMLIYFIGGIIHDVAWAAVRLVSPARKWLLSAVQTLREYVRNALASR